MVSPTVRVLILNFNGESDSISCISSILRDSNISQKDIVVVDNGSVDTSVESIRRLFPNVRVFENPSNLGYAGGYNEALARLLREDVTAFLLLNNDTVVRPGAVTTMLRTLTLDPYLGIVGPAVVNMNSDVIQSEGARINWYTGRTIALHQGENHNDTPRQVEDVDYLSGCAIMVTPAVFLKIGLFPVHFFMFSEEVDLCIRARKGGFGIRCNPEAVVEHRRDRTAGQYPAMRNRLLVRNRLLIAKRHCSVLQYISTVIWMTLIEMPTTCYFETVRSGFSRPVLHRFWGIIHGLRDSLSENRI